MLGMTWTSVVVWLNQSSVFVFEVVAQTSATTQLVKAKTHAENPGRPFFPFVGREMTATAQGEIRGITVKAFTALCAGK